MPITENVAFVHIPRTGGHSVSELMGLDPYSTDAEHLTGFVGNEQLGHFTAAEMQARVGRSGRVWFSVVRNPWERLVSEFCFRADQNKFPQFATQTRWPSWPEFVARFTSGEPASDRDGGRHLLRQCDFLFDAQGNLLVDRVFQFRDLATVGREIFNRPIRHTHKSSDHRPWHEWYDADTEAAVGDYFRNDIALTSAESPSRIRGC
jgi:hypothetical protein